MVAVFGITTPELSLMLVTIAVELGYYLLVWALVGRDRPPGVIMPLWEPPRAYSPAALRYLSRLGQVDHGRCPRRFSD